MKKEKIMGTKRWLFWISIGVVLIFVYKFIDNFDLIGNWINNLLSIIGPFLVGILLAYVLYTPCSKIEKALKGKIKNPRKWSITILYTILALVLFIICEFIIPILVASIIDLVKNAPSYYNAITTNEWNISWLPFIKDNVLKPVVDYIQSIDYHSMVTPDKIWLYLLSAFGIMKSIIDFFIAIVCSTFILAERENMVKYIKKLAKSTMSTNGYKKFNRYFSKGNKIFFDFISSQVVDAIVVAVLMSIVMLIMGVKYAILLGVIIGLFNLIPYFGAIIAVVIAGLVTILTGGWQQAIIMTIVITIVQQIDANIINPKITSSKLNISPLLVIFSVTVGGAYWGITGMFLAVPIAVLIKLMLDDFIENKEKESKETKEIKESKETKETKAQLNK